MNSAIEISLCLVAWTVVIFKSRNIRWKNVLTTDRVALNVWLSMLFFAITLTFLVEVFADFFDALTYNNFSRPIAYSAVTLSLYFITAASIYTLQAPPNKRILRYLRPLLVLTLTSLFLTYARHISRTPQWQDHHVPSSVPEAVFMFSMYSFAFLLCLTLFSLNFRYLRQEKADVMRFRVIAVAITAMTGGTYFFVKVLLVAGYFWPPLSSDLIVTISKILLILSALLWAGTFMSNKIYVRLLRRMKSLFNWMALKDLEYILVPLNRLCPPVAITESRPTSRQFLRNSEYYLYRAIIRILDGETMLSDFLEAATTDKKPEWWDDGSMQEAGLINQALQSVDPCDDFWDLVREYRRASKNMLRNRSIMPNLEAAR